MNILNQTSTYKPKRKKCCTSKQQSHFQGRWELNLEEEGSVGVFFIQVNVYQLCIYTLEKKSRLEFKPNI